MIIMAVWKNSFGLFARIKGFFSGRKKKENYPGADGSYYDYAAQGGARTGRFGCSACGFNQKR